MKKHTDITIPEVEKLLQRFMDGTSTLEEEAQLAEFFRTHKVAGEWATYKDMFALFDEGKVEVEEKRESTAWWKYAGIAAAIALLLGIGFYFNSQNDEKPQFIAHTDSVKTTPQTETKKVEEQSLKPVEQGERADTVKKVKETQKIIRPPKTYMAKMEGKEDVSTEKKELPDSIVFTASPYHIASEELSEPEIRRRGTSTLVEQGPRLAELSYDELKHEIQQRGERMSKNIELAFNPEEDF
jgi:tRNA G10  N-methylase Trm11